MFRYFNIRNFDISKYRVFQILTPTLYDIETLFELKKIDFFKIL